MEDREYLLISIPADLDAALRKRGCAPRDMAERFSEWAMTQVLAVLERVYPPTKGE